MSPGDLAWVLNVACYTARPLFFNWDWKDISLAVATFLERGAVVLVLSGTIINPFDLNVRFRKVLTPIGVGYMYEKELFSTAEDARDAASRLVV